MPLPWIKMWLEALDDPKLTRLTLAERGAWWELLQLAGKCDAGGKILSGGEGLDIEEIVDALHIKTAADRQSLESMLAKMEERGSLMWNEGHKLTVIHWEERQRIPPSARPEAVAERVRRHRKSRKETGKGNEVQPLPKVGEDKEVPPVVAQDEEKVLAVWSGVKGFPQDSKEATRFLIKLRAEFPDVDILDVSRSWAAAKLSEPLTKRSMPFKQLRAWMKKERQFAQERGEGEQRPRQKRARPITYIRGSEEVPEKD